MGLGLSLNNIKKYHYQIGQFSQTPHPIEPGLYVVATPIGNLGDITIRALETLARADIIACEDTRTSRKLLDRFAIKSKLIAYHEHNASKAGQTILDALNNELIVALISDAGTPLISDPGYRIINETRTAGHRIIPIPGASSLLTALMAAGLPTDQFVYAGFLPSKEKARHARFEEFSSFDGTLVFFESPNRLMASLEAAEDIFGENCRAAVCRELTKLHEEFTTGSLAELIAHYRNRSIKGEVVFLIASEPNENGFSDADIDQLLSEFSKELSTGKAASKAADMTGKPRKELYQRLIQLKRKADDGAQ